MGQPKLRGDSGPCYHDDPSMVVVTFTKTTIWGHDSWTVRARCACKYAIRGHCFDQEPAGEIRTAAAATIVAGIAQHGRNQRRRDDICAGRPPCYCDLAEIAERPCPQHGPAVVAP